MKVWRPYTQMHLAHPQSPVKYTKGSYIHLEDGTKKFDGISSWWLITHGHCDSKITQAVADQAKKIDQVVFANFNHRPAELLINELKKILPTELNSVFFSDNGSTSVEVAMKMAYQYCQIVGSTSKNKFCAFERSYHGDTFGAMSVNANGIFMRSYKDLRIDVIRCKQGHFSSDDLNLWINDFTLKIQKHHHEMIAVILEPMIQGATGMIIWPVEAVKRICELCKKYNVLLIFDEVMTGFGRTGKMFAFEHVGVIPDFVCLSKGLTGGTLPLALTLTTHEIYEAFLSEDSSKMFFHGHSFTANPLSCAAACANLKIFRNTHTLNKILKIEDIHKKSIKKLKKRIEMKDVRILGSIGAIELFQKASYGSQFSKQLYSECFSKGVYLRPLGNVIYLMPPYNTNEEEIERAWNIIGDIIEKTQRLSFDH